MYVYHFIQFQCNSIAIHINIPIVLIHNIDNDITNRINIPIVLLRGSNNYIPDGINTIPYQTFPFGAPTSVTSQTVLTSCYISCSYPQQ